jgi:hypothetical protein
VSEERNRQRRDRPPGATAQQERRPLDIDRIVILRSRNLGRDIRDPIAAIGGTISTNLCV